VFRSFFDHPQVKTAPQAAFTYRGTCTSSLPAENSAGTKGVLRKGEKKKLRFTLSAAAQRCPPHIGGAPQHRRCDTGIRKGMVKKNV